MPERENLQKQLEKTKRRLAVLELQLVQFGPLHAPAHLITEIEDAQKEIAELEERFRLAPASPPKPPSPTKVERTDVPLLRVFLASPGDVNEERKVAQEVLDMLQYDLLFKPGVSLQIVAWDKPGNDTPMRVTLTPQTAIKQGLPLPSQCDIVLVLFWGRMGTPLPFPEYQKEDGSPYLSGTEWEFWEALKGERTSGSPITLVYRRTEPPRINITDRNQVAQFYKVQDFFEQFRDKTTGALLAGINEYSDPENLRVKLTNHLRTIIYRLISEEQVEPEESKPPVPPIAQAPRWQGSPFPGLRAFSEADAPIFFGRGIETGELVKRLESSRFVGVIAASGSGKSSLVAAGLIPRLKANAIASGETGSKDWRFVCFKPGRGDSPLVALFEGLCQAFPGHQVSPFMKVQEKRAFVESVTAQPPALIEICEGLLTEANAPAWAEILYFVDQFEELFSLVAENQRLTFIALLGALCSSRRFRVVVTMRSDFYDKCLEIPALASLLKEASYPLALPTAGALVEMIKRPAERTELNWDEGLPERIQEETGSKPGALALMAYLLDELYKVAEKRGDRRLSFDDYRALEGVEGAIGKRAEETFNSLRGMEEEKVRLLGRVFRELVEVNDEGKPTRRRTPYSCFEGAEKELVEAFTQARLLVKDKEQVEVAHEALFRSWKRLAEWIAERQDDFMLRRQVRNAAAEWKNENYPVYLRWLKERLEPVYAMQERLEWQPDELEEKFIEAEQKWRLREIDNPQTTHQLREETGYRLGRIGDTRPNLGVGEAGIADIMWLLVMPGGKLKIEQETFEVEPFYISKYLITYPQYEAFVKAGDGYNNPEWWQGMPKEYQRQKLYTATVRLGNYPRDSVSWYQAVAYTRWLSRRMEGLEIANPGNLAGEPYIIGKNAAVRLPTEGEWQWAAQGGPEGRKYPWGEWAEGYANTDEAELGRTMAVGMYPQGAAKCGAMDMAGNMWEWCLNKYSKSKETEVDESGDKRVLRGGSCSNDPDLASCVYRNSGNPNHDFTGVGVRVVVVSALSRPSDL